MPLGPDRRRLWVDNLGEGQVFRASRRRRLLSGDASHVGDQESVSRDAERGVVMEAAPSSSFVMAESEFLLQFLVVPLDPPALLGEVHQPFEGNLLGQGGEPVFGRFVLRLRATRSAAILPAWAP